MATGLPPGLSASLSGNVVTISGTPAQTGTFGGIAVSLQDGTGATASATYGLTITPAATFVVTTASDAAGHSGESLRDAVAQADAEAALGFSDTITFAPGLGGQTITLAQGQLELKGAGTITIDGGGQITISGNNASRVFQVDAGAQAVLKGLTVRNGNLGSSSATGGGINNNGTLTLSNSVLSGNSALDGGGICNNGTMTVNNCTISGNSTYAWASSTLGGGIDNAGWLTVNNSTLVGNKSYQGGGIYNGNTLTVTDCTIAGNSAYMAPASTTTARRR